MAFQTEFEFTLPMGYIGSDGQLYKNGTMRLATAMDEIQVLRDMRTRNNDAYVVILLLSRDHTNRSGYEHYRRND